MKILKQGKSQDKKFQGSCIKCGCEIEAEPREIRWVHDRNEIFKVVDCPNCDNKFLYVKEVQKP